MKQMPVKKFVVTIERMVIETVTLQIDAASRRDAMLKAGLTIKDQDWEWERDTGDARVGSVELAQPEPADPMTIPASLKREEKSNAA
jgi:hypothetical protein